MKKIYDSEFLDYYTAYCELTIWFRKIVVTNGEKFITIKDIEEELIAERNHILLYIPQKRKSALKKNLDKIASAYYARISNWSTSQKITIDMV
jgi:hypothetical protein